MSLGRFVAVYSFGCSQWISDVAQEIVRAVAQVAQNRRIRHHFDVDEGDVFGQCDVYVRLERILSRIRH